MNGLGWVIVDDGIGFDIVGYQCVVVDDGFVVDLYVGYEYCFGIDLDVMVDQCVVCWLVVVYGVGEGWFFVYEVEGEG